jgi:LacI family transcriptional regulator
MTSPTPLNIREVARLAAVSPSTVSLVMNGMGRVAESTRIRVQEVLRSTGYTPGRAGRRPLQPHAARVETRSRRLALLNVGTRRSALNAPVYVDVIRGVEAAVSQKGLTLLLRHLSPEETRIDDLFAQRVDGIILFGSPHHADLASQLKKGPCVEIMGRSSGMAPWDHLTYANRSIGLIAAQYLRARGHEHVALLSATEDDGVFRERARTFHSEWASTGKGSCACILEPDLLMEDAQAQHIDAALLRKVMDRILTGRSAPTGLFLTADLLAAPVQAELNRRGLRPGHDVDLICCNNERVLLSSLHPRPATIDIHAENIGARAVTQLLWRIANPGEPRQDVLIDPSLVRGEADAARPTRPS